MRRLPAPGQSRAGRPGGGLPSGTLIVLLGVAINGIAVYAFLLMPARSGLVEPAAYASLASAWFIVFTVVTGLLTPLEQELTILVAAQRISATGAKASVHRVVGLAFGAVAIVATLLVLLRSWLANEALGEQGLVLGAAGAILAYVGFQAVRGILAGAGHFGAYSRLLMIDGLARVGGATILVAFGVTSVTAYGALIAIPAALAGLVMMAARPRVKLTPGEVPSWGAASQRLGSLVGNQLASQLVLNLAPFGAALLATPSQRSEAGRLSAGFLVARVPLFLFQAVQTALLPRFVELLEREAIAEFKQQLRHLWSILIATGVLGCLLTAAIGPATMRLSFGEDFALGSTALVVLVAGTVLIAVAMTSTQALVAARKVGHSTIGWLIGLVPTAVGMAVLSGLTTRLTWSYLAGALTSAVWLSIVALRGTSSR